MVLFFRMSDPSMPLVSKADTVAAINILTARQGHPRLSEVQINMVHAMVLRQNSLNQLATGKDYIHYKLFIFTMKNGYDLECESIFKLGLQLNTETDLDTTTPHSTPVGTIS